LHIVGKCSLRCPGLIAACPTVLCCSVLQVITRQKAGDIFFLERQRIYDINTILNLAKTNKVDTAATGQEMVERIRELKE